MITLTVPVPFGTLPVDVFVQAERASAFSVEGLPEHQAREVKVRVLSACSALGLRPRTRVMVRSEYPFPSGALDLTVAVAALAAEGVIRDLPESVPSLHGELSLGGTLRPVRGLYAALRRGGLAVVPATQAHEAALSPSRCCTVTSLADVVEGRLVPLPPKTPEILPYEAPRDAEFESTTGAVLLISKPGGGTTLLARRYAADLLPPTDVEEVLATWSVAGLFPPEGPMRVPFRAPHHTVSEAGLLGGGGSNGLPRPGEVSLAHGGCLLLDEVSEFRRASLEALARVLHDGYVQIVRGGLRAKFPAKPQLVVGTCRPEDLARARKMFPWTEEVQL